MHIKENVVNLEQLEDATMWTHFLLDEIYDIKMRNFNIQRLYFLQQKKKKDYMTRVGSTTLGTLGKNFK